MVQGMQNKNRVVGHESSLLGDGRGDDAFLDILKNLRAAVHCDDFHFPDFACLLDGRGGSGSPGRLDATKAREVGVALHEIRRRLRRTDGVAGGIHDLDDLHFRVFGDGVAVALDALLEVGLSDFCHECDFSFAAQNFRHLHPAGITRPMVSRSDECTTVGVREIRIDGDDGNPRLDRFIDDRGERFLKADDDQTAGLPRYRELEGQNHFVHVVGGGTAVVGLDAEHLADEPHTQLMVIEIIEMSEHGHLNVHVRPPAGFPGDGRGFFFSASCQEGKGRQDEDKLPHRAILQKAACAVATQFIVDHAQFQACVSLNHTENARSGQRQLDKKKCGGGFQGSPTMRGDRGVAREARARTCGAAESGILNPSPRLSAFWRSPRHFIRCRRRCRCV